MYFAILDKNKDRLNEVLKEIRNEGGNVVPLYLVSMSPGDEFGKILKQRGLTQYFKKVYLSSWKKVDAIDDILRREGVLAYKTVCRRCL